LPKTNEPVKTVEHREYQYPSFFIDPSQLTLHEAVSMDKWYQEPFLPPKDKVHLEYTYPSEFRWSYPLGVSVSEIATSVYQTQQLPPRGVEHREYQYPSVFWHPRIILKPLVVSNADVHIVFPEQRQYKAFTEPLEPSLRPSHEEITLDKWIGNHPDKVWGVKHFEFTYPSLFIDPYALTLSERVDLDKWFVELQRPPKGQIHREHEYPYLFAPTRLLINPTVIAGPYAHVIFPEVFQYQKLSLFNISAFDERITMEKWFRPLSEPRWDVKRHQWMYPSFFMFDKLALSIWTPEDEGSSTFTKTGKSSSSFAKVAKSTSAYALVAKGDGTFVKVAKSSSTWTKETEPPAIIFIPEDTRG
jgi:hypothetical protein